VRWAVLPLILAATAAAHADWPQFRGPDGMGRADEAALPLTWSETKNVRWKTAVHGRGWSSPIVLEGRVWVTTATPDGRRLSALALDEQSGRVVFDLELFQVENPQYAHPFNSYASPTPVAEPGRVYVTFGSPGTAAIDTRTGKVIWARRDLDCNHFRGAGSSPILFRDLLIMHFDGSDTQYVVALDKHTGRTVWRTARTVDFEDLGPDGKPQADGDLRKAFATPHVLEVDGTPVLVSLGSMAMYGYDPMTGRELWRLDERSGFSSSTRPVAGDGLLFFPTGFPNGQLVAVRLAAKEDLRGPREAWRVTRGVPEKPSVVLAGDLLIMVDDGGIATCLKAKTGEEVWKARVGGTFSASPLLGANRVYFFDEDGKATVIEAAPTFKVLAENQLEDGFMASPAVSGRSLVLRTKTHVYAIAEGSGH
jgi:outer membrane protein assembly factor BamB